MAATSWTEQTATQTGWQEVMAQTDIGDVNVLFGVLIVQPAFINPTVSWDECSGSLDNWTEQSATRYGWVEVVSAGVPGYIAFQCAALLPTYGSPQASWTESSETHAGWQEIVAQADIGDVNVLFGVPIVQPAFIDIATSGATWAESSVSSTSYTEGTVAATTWTEQT